MHEVAQLGHDVHVRVDETGQDRLPAGVNFPVGGGGGPAPISAMRSPSMRNQPRRGSAPVPSMMVPLWITVLLAMLTSFFAISR